MGINDTQYVIIRHHNTPNPHCHLIFNRVDNNGKRISDSNWLKRNVRVCKELKQKYGLTFGEGKSQTRTERLRPNERTRYELANDVKSALKNSHSWKDFSSNLKAYGINAQIKFRSGTHIPQDHSLTTDLSMLAADLAIGLIASGQEKKSEEQDIAPNKKRGPRL